MFSSLPLPPPPPEFLLMENASTSWRILHIMDNSPHLLIKCGESWRFLCIFGNVRRCHALSEIRANLHANLITSRVKILPPPLLPLLLLEWRLLVRTTMTTLTTITTMKSMKGCVLFHMRNILNLDQYNCARLIPEHPSQLLPSTSTCSSSVVPFKASLVSLVESLVLLPLHMAGLATSNR